MLLYQREDALGRPGGQRARQLQCKSFIGMDGGVLPHRKNIIHILYIHGQDEGAGMYSRLLSHPAAIKSAFDKTLRL